MFYLQCSIYDDYFILASIYKSLIIFILEFLATHIAKANDIPKLTFTTFWCNGGLMFKKLLYFFRKTSHPTQSSIAVKESAKIDTEDQENIENSVDKILEEVNQIFTDWQHTGLNSIHPTEIEHCEEQIEQLQIMEKEYGSSQAGQLLTQLNEIKATMHSSPAKNSTKPENTQESRHKNETEISSCNKTNNRQFDDYQTNSNHIEKIQDDKKASVDVIETSPKKTHSQADSVTLKETTSISPTPAEATVNIEPAISKQAPDIIESSASGLADDSHNITIKMPSNNTPTVNTDPSSSIFNDELMTGSSIIEQPDRVEINIENSESSALEADSTELTEKTVQNSHDNEKNQPLIYLPILAINTPFMCLEHQQIEKESDIYKKLPKRAKTLLDKHGTWVKPTHSLPYKTDITVSDNQDYFQFLKHLAKTIDDKAITPEKKVAELDKIDKKESWVKLATSHFGNDSDWKILKSIEMEVKNIKGINTKQAAILFKQGYTTKEAICKAPDDILLALPRVGKATLDKIRKSIE